MHRFFTIACAVITGISGLSVQVRPLSPVAHASAIERIGKAVQPSGLQIGFEPNRGQIGDPSVLYFARLAGAILLVRSAGLQMCLQNTFANRAAGAAALERRSARGAGVPATVVTMHLVDARTHSQSVGLRRLPGHVNEFLGNEPRRWRTNLPLFGQVELRGVYPDIDLLLHGSSGNAGGIEYDWVLHPGSSPNDVRMTFPGSSSPKITHDGRLAVPAGLWMISQGRPIAYQVEGGHRLAVSVAFQIDASGIVRLRLGRFDPHLNLIVDPTISYATYLGGKGDDGVSDHAMRVDSAGNLYLTGSTTSPDFPTVNPAQKANGGGFCFVDSRKPTVCSDAYVTKLNPAGTAPVFSTYLGGKGTDNGSGLAIDSSGDVFVTGGTDSADFPTVHAMQPRMNGPDDGFVAGLDPTGGALLFSTYVGGSADDSANAVAVQPSGSLVVEGAIDSTDFPLLHALKAYAGGACADDSGSPLPCVDPFVLRLSADGSTVVSSTFIGGPGGQDDFGGVALDTSGDIYVSGGTSSHEFPVVSAYQKQNASFGGDNAYVVKLNPDASKILFSTYFGGSGNDYANGMAVDTSGNVYVGGHAFSPDFPTTAGVFSRVSTAGDGAWIAKFSASGRLGYSTVFDAGNSTSCHDVAVDAAGDAYCGGWAFLGKSLPLVSPVQSQSGGGFDGIVVKLNPTGSKVLFGSYLGGPEEDRVNTVLVDNKGGLYIEADTQSTNMMTYSAFQDHSGGWFDAWIVKLDEGTKAQTTVTCAKGTVLKGGKCVKKTVKCKKGYTLVHGACKKKHT